MQLTAFAFHDLLACFVIYQVHLSRSGIGHGGLWFLIPIINQENDPRACLQTKMVGAFPQLLFFFPDDNSLSQNKIKEQKNKPKQNCTHYLP